MNEFCKRAEDVLRQVADGQAFVVTHLGRPVARVEPIGSQAISADDSIYQLEELASGRLEPMTNAEIDRLVYKA